MYFTHANSQLLSHTISLLSFFFFSCISAFLFCQDSRDSTSSSEAGYCHSCQVTQCLLGTILLLWWLSHHQASLSLCGHPCCFSQASPFPLGATSFAGTTAASYERCHTLQEPSHPLDCATPSLRTAISCEVCHHLCQSTKAACVLCRNRQDSPDLLNLYFLLWTPKSVCLCSNISKSFK